jgi:hypothetical protein
MEKEQRALNMDVIFRQGGGDDKNDEGVYIRPHGTGDHATDAGHGWPVLVETYNGRPQVVIWSDINNDEPTHVIDLSGALESSRIQEDN